jgi:hypothetical protein
MLLGIITFSSLILIVIENSIINHNEQQGYSTKPVLSPNDFKPENDYFNQTLFDIYDIAYLGEEICDVSSADFNNDGLIDIVSACSYYNSKIIIFYNLGNLEFIQKQIYNFGNDIKGLVAGDYDNDGDIDLIFTSSENEIIDGIPYRINGTVNILFNENEGNFSKKLLVRRGTGIPKDDEGRINPRVTSSDFDMDGDLDLLVGDNSGKVEMFENDGAGNFSTVGIIHDFGDLSWGLASADFNEELGDDFIVAATEKGDITKGGIYFKQNQINKRGDGICFDEGSGEIIAEICHLPATACLTALDYDNDGDEDFIAGTRLLIYLFINNKANFQPLTVAHSGEEDSKYEVLHNAGLATADFNNDGLDDFTLGASRGILRVFINNNFT